MLKKSNSKKLFTTPSHSGKLALLHKFYQWYKCDVSETDAYNPEHELKNAEEYAAKVYGTKITKFLTNGSTSGIIASVLASCNACDRLLIWEHSHICHKNAAILAGANIIEYSMPYNSEWGVYEGLPVESAEELIQNTKPKAMILTSPTYEGIVSNVKKISKICSDNGVILIVDEAHGALYPFSDKLPQTSITYANFTIQSLHKTAGGINPTALLHCNCDLDIESALKKINTTSPSYPMLATIEANIRYLNSTKGRKSIDDLCMQIQTIKKKLTNFHFYGDDITKILIKKDGLSGYELSELLYDKFNIEDERTNNKSTMLLTGIGTSKRKLSSLLKLKNI